MYNFYCFCIFVEIFFQPNCFSYIKVYHRQTFMAETMLMGFNIFSFLLCIEFRIHGLWIVQLTVTKHSIVVFTETGPGKMGKLLQKAIVDHCGLCGQWQTVKHLIRYFRFSPFSRKHFHFQPNCNVLIELRLLNFDFTELNYLRFKSHSRNGWKACKIHINRCLIMFFWGRWFSVKLPSSTHKFCALHSTHFG